MAKGGANLLRQNNMVAREIYRVEKWGAAANDVEKRRDCCVALRRSCISVLYCIVTHWISGWRKIGTVAYVRSSSTGRPRRKTLRAVAMVCCSFFKTDEGCWAATHESKRTFHRGRANLFFPHPKTWRHIEEWQESCHA